MHEIGVMSIWNAPIQNVAITAFVAGLCWCAACQIVGVIFGKLRRPGP